MASSFDGESSGPVRFGHSKEVQTSSAPTDKSSFTRYSRLDFPRFYGYDLKSWFYMVDHFFSLEKIAFDEKVKVACVH